MFAGVAAASLFVGQEKSETKSKPTAEQKSYAKTPASSTAKSSDTPSKTKTKSSDDGAAEKDVKKSDTKKSEKSDADAFHKVATEFLKQETTLSGVFEAVPCGLSNKQRCCAECRVREADPPALAENFALDCRSKRGGKTCRASPNLAGCREWTR